MTITEQLAQFTVKTRYETLPPDVVAHAKELLLDTCAILIGGINEDCTRIATELTQDMGGVEESTMVPSGERTNAANAAFVNGISAHALEMDESTAGGHSSCVIFPALLALAEARKISGKDFLTAYVVGMELQNRLGLTASTHIYWRGQHQVSHVGGLSAAFASAKILGLDLRKVRMAAGLDASSNGGIRKNIGTMAKRIHAGNSARNAVMAALLAERGYIANADILDGDTSGAAPRRVRRSFDGQEKEIIDHVHQHFGWLNTFCGEGNYDVRPLTADLGQRWLTIPSRTMIRFFPCSTTAFVPIELALRLRRDHAIDPAHIERIELGVSTDAITAAGWTQVSAGEETRFSIPYAVAVSLLDGKASIDKFVDGRVQQPDIQSFLKKVQISVDPDADRALVEERKDPDKGAEPMAGHWARVTIRMDNGQKFSAAGNTCKGSWRNPASFDDIVAKLNDCASYSKFSQRQGVQLDRLVDIVRNIDKAENLSDLTQAMGRA
jgi:2-methylcitrate dehydratase PrpD